jgi:hypothetical protein
LAAACEADSIGPDFGSCPEKLDASGDIVRQKIKIRCFPITL